MKLSAEFLDTTTTSIRWQRQQRAHKACRNGETCDGMRDAIIAEHNTVVAWLWLRQALLASARLNAGSTADEAFYLGKVQACRYFFAWELPKCRVHAEILGRQDTTCLDMRNEWF